MKRQRAWLYQDGKLSTSFWVRLPNTLSTRRMSSAHWNSPEADFPCAPACSWTNLKGSVTRLEVRSIQDLVNDPRVAQQVLS